MSERDFDPIKKANAYLYRGTVLRVVDGDTVDIELDLGFSLSFKQRFRLYAINAPELRGAEREAGIKSKEALQEMIEGKKVLIRTYKDKQGKYGRYLAYIYSCDDEICINDEMVVKGYAVKYGA
jgi:micrococcal nuclease